MSLLSNARTFTGLGQAGNWLDPANWGGDAPGPNNTALVQISASMSGSLTVNRLMFLGTQTTTINGALTTLYPGLCESFMVCNGADVTFTPDASLDAVGGIVVGIHSVGTLVAEGNLSHHATLTTAALKLGEFDNGTGHLTIDDAVLNDSANLYVGLAGAGALTLENGGHATIGTDIIVAAQAGSTGTLTIGAGTELSAGGIFKMCAGGTAAMGAGSVFSVAGGFGLENGAVFSIAGGTLSVGGVYTGTGPEAEYNGIRLSDTALLSGFGTVTTTGAGGIEDQGTIAASGGTLLLGGDISGRGTLQIGAGSTLHLTAATIGVPSIQFTGADGTLALANGVVDQATIHGFGIGDSIDMYGIDALSWNAGTDVLTLSDGGHVVDTLQFAGNFASDSFTLTHSGSLGMITLVPSGH
jgi:T5SS/PEP-CTERM-associated repeat protein